MGKFMMIEYEVKPEKLDECVMSINRFVQAVRTNESRVLRYEAYRRGKGMSFVHFIEFSDESVETAHKDMPHTKQFVAELYPNCVNQPIFTELITIGPTKKTI